MTEEAHDAVLGYLILNHKRSKIYDKVYGSRMEYFRDGKYGLVPYEKFGNNSIVFLSKRKWWGLRGVFIFSRNSIALVGENGHNPSEGTEKIYSTLTCVRGTINFDNLLLEANRLRNSMIWTADEDEQKENESERFNIFYVPEENGGHYQHYNGATGFAWFREPTHRLIGVDTKELGKPYVGKGKALDNLFYPKEVKDLISSIEIWLKSRDWYQDKNIPWKKGWLLYGIPGTGKTALVRAFAEDLNLPIYVYSLSQMSNKTFSQAWKDMQSNTPCIALIEDFDNVFEGRNNISRRGLGFGGMFVNGSGESEHDHGEKEGTLPPLSFDCLLNCIDGVDKTNGVFTIITTNNINKIDEAIGRPVVNEHGTNDFISSRPGRIDRAIELGYMTRENKILMAQKFLSQYPVVLEQVHGHIIKEKDETPAQFQEYCAQLAVQAYWDSIEAESKVKDLMDAVETDILERTKS